MASNTKFMNPSTIAKPGGYSHVVEITGPARIVYIAGQLGLKPNGDIAGDFRAQVVQAFENLKSALAAVGRAEPAPAASSTRRIGRRQQPAQRGASANR